MYDSAQKQLRLVVQFLSLEVETHWSSTFEMTCNFYKTRAISISIDTKVVDLGSFQVQQEAKERALTVYRFLESAASLVDSNLTRLTLH